MTEKIYPATKWNLVLIWACVGYLCGHLTYGIIATPGYGSGDFVFTVLLLFLVPLWILLLRSVARRSSPLVMNQYGITYVPFKKQVGVDQVPWHVLKEARLSKLFKMPIVKLELNEPQRENEVTLVKSHERVFGHSILIYSENLKGSGKDLVSDINQFIHNKQMQTDAAKVAPLI